MNTVTERNIKDYLHLYIGCEVVVCDLDGQIFNDHIESVIHNKQGKAFSIYEFGDCYFENLDEYCQWIKPILRPLSDMTEEESLTEFPDKLTSAERAAEVTRFLLSKHFDLFNLIPDGLAISTTKQ